MLKKILALTLGASLVATAAFADVSVVPEDVEKDLMNVTSSGFAGEELSIIITNPGYTLEQALSGENGAIQYFGAYTPENESFSVPVQITGAAGGEFNIYILSQDGEESGSFVFYNSVFKKKCIDDINLAGENQDITDYYRNLIMSYGLESNELYIALGAEKCAPALMSIRNTLPGKALPESVSEVMELIEKSFILAAVNDEDSGLCFRDGKFVFADELNLADSEEILDYYESIDSDFIEEFNKEFLSGNYKSTDEITERFKELVYINVLLNYEKRGYGHIHGFFEKYEDAYEAAGFKIPSKENDSIYRQLLELEADTLKELAGKFNKLKEEDEPKKGSSKGSGGGGGSGSFDVGAGTSYIEEEKDISGSVAEPVGDNVFKDVSGDFWAYEAIKSLTETGVINGYEDGTFRPEARITRAEYAKLLISIFSIAPGEKADFADVSSDAWYAPYVAAAQENGIINGDGVNFNPDESLKRQDAAVILCRLLKKESDAELGFDDVNLVSDYAYSSIAYLVGEGVINGYEDNTFRPVNTISRAEVAKILHTLMEKGVING